MTNNITANPHVAIVVPTKDGLSHLKYSLPSLLNTNYDNYYVVLVDDGSSDDSLNFVAREYANISILKNTGKTGFAGSVNTGIRHALASSASYIAVFNNDIQVLPEWLNLILPIFAKEQNVGLVGFTEINRERQAIFFSYSLSSTPIAFRSVQRLAGCLYLCSDTTFKQIGLFDEDYFMYGEDNDFFFRLSAAGFKILETNVPVWHYGEGSSENNKLLTTWLAYRNALRFSIKNESLLMVVRMVISLLNQGCNPFLRRSADNPVFRRMRRYNPIVNISLIIGSCVWNLWHLRQTLIARLVLK